MLKFKSDTHIEAELGARLKKLRLAQNLTQKTLAQTAGISRRTITNLENGEGCTLATLIAIVRALGALDQFETLFVGPDLSPMEELRRHRKKERKYASSPRKPKPPTEWQWADEKETEPREDMP